MSVPGSDDPTIPPSQMPTREATRGADASDFSAQSRSDGSRAPAIPESFGQYRIVRLIGEGGMGAVYEAEQARPKRTVALKVIRPGYATERTLRRFEMEAEVLGRLLHPGIAQIYEAGVWTSPEREREGLPPTPFFAMELVKGVPLTQYAAEKKLSTRERLELVAKVCDAVQHAHQKGVIHRDLKPANILVVDEVAEWHSGGVAKGESRSERPARAGHLSATLPLHHSATSSVGQPKILDFGVARATDSDIQQTTVQTDVGAIIGTIPYMSPEQVGGDPAELDTRSDVYALGVIAYELLVGRLPYDLERKMIHEAARVIREEEPTRLSSIDRALRGDVETIVAHALEKDKARRYGAASALAADIRRYLSDEPISARPASTWYQLAKFSRRNKGLVSGVAAAFVILIAGLFATLVQRDIAIRARDAESVALKNEADQRRVAEGQRDEADRARKESDLIAEFMSDTLKGAGPSVALGRDTTMLKEMMDAAAARIEKGDLKEAPGAELRLRGTIGNTYRELAKFENAMGLLEPAVELARRLHPGDHPDTANALNSLSVLAQARGDLQGAESLVRESLDMSRRLSPGDHPDVATGMHNLAAILKARGDLAEAERLFRQAVEMFGRLFPDGSPKTAASLANLARVLVARGDFSGAETMLNESLEMTRNFYRGDHPDVAINLQSLAQLLQARGDPAGAVVLYRRALEMRTRLVSGDDPDTATAMNNLAGALRGQGDLAGAESLYRDALAMWKRLYGRDHADLAAGMNNLANLLKERADLAGAEALFRESLDMTRRLFPGDHPDVAIGLNNLASVLQDRGDLIGAETIFREVLGMLRRTSSEDHPSVATVLSNLSLLLQSRGEFSEAESMCRESLEMKRRLFPGDHIDVAVGLNNLARLLQARGEFEDAERRYVESIEMMRRLFKGDHPKLATGLSNLAGLLQARGNLDRAEPLLREAVGILKRCYPGGHPDTATCLNNLARLLCARGNAAAAEPLCRESTDMFVRLLGPDHRLTGNARHGLGYTLALAGRFAEAESELLEAERVLSNAQDAPVAWKRTCAQSLVNLYESRDRAEPGKGYDAKAAEWKARLDALSAASSAPK